MISLDNLEKAKPLAEQLKAVRQAINEINQAPCTLNYFVHGNYVLQRGPSGSLTVPNSVVRDLLRREEDRLRDGLKWLGVDA